MLATLASPGGGAQEPAPPLAVEEAIDVRVVNVDVVVFDKRGRPVTDLGKEDFVLFEDRQPVAISHFAAPLAGTPGAAEALEAAGTSASPTGGDATSAPVGATVALLLDERTLAPASRRRVVQTVETLEDEPALAGARVVVGRYRDRLEWREASSVEEVSGWLEAEEPTAGSVERRIALRRALSSMEASYDACEATQLCEPCHDNWLDMLGYARTFASGEEARVAEALARLGEALAALSGLPGGAWLLYPAESLPHRPGIEAYSYLGEICGSRRSDADREVQQEILLYDESGRLLRLGAWANARGVRLFPIDTLGLETPASASVDVNRSDLRPSARFDELVRANRQSGLFMLAEETGGRAVLDSNRPLADLDLGRELAGRYSLGFQPAHPATGQTHLLKVELVKPAGRTLRYRRSYLDRTLEQRLADRLLSALHFELDDNPLGAAIELGELTAGARPGAVRVPLVVGVPAERLVRLPVPGETGAEGRGSLRLWLAAQRDDGVRTVLRQETFAVGPGGLEAKQGIHRLAVEMELEPGRWTIALGVRDELTHRSSVLRRVVDVGAP
ncbi:MAG TPA: VWA domain-containing protein [Thermoanaerobaculia bacterium]|nr:VWA domain-containing protein [Thermoanaerobaculia bacterium]